MYIRDLTLNYQVLMRIISFFPILLLLPLCFVSNGQNPELSPQSIHSHNDYQKEEPFWNAFNHKVGIIEVDLYYHEGKVVVAHDPSELEKPISFEEKYLKPLKHLMKENNGYPYPDTALDLAVMFDIKNERNAVMDWILDVYEENPDVFDTRKPVKIVISGNRPEPDSWLYLPENVYIDGRLTDPIYASEQASLRDKVFIVSSSYRVIGNWNGIGECPPGEQEKIRKIVGRVHSAGLKLRFWGNRDTEAFWDILLENGVDIIGTDDVERLVDYLGK